MTQVIAPDKQTILADWEKVHKPEFEAKLDVDEYLKDPPFGEEIVVIEWHERTGSYGKDGQPNIFYAIAALRRDGKTVGFNSGSEVIKKQLRSAQLPFRGVISKAKGNLGDYHTFGKA